MQGVSAESSAQLSPQANSVEPAPDPATAGRCTCCNEDDVGLQDLLLAALGVLHVQLDDVPLALSLAALVPQLPLQALLGEGPLEVLGNLPVLRPTPGRSQGTRGHNLVFRVWI